MSRYLQKLGMAFLLCLLAGSLGLAQKSSRFFRVEQRNGVWWFITPDGKPFFSNGVNVIDTGTTPENYRQKNPEWALFRFYKNEKEWRDETFKRLKSWNFNTIGGWSDEKLEASGEMPYVKTFYWGDKLVPWGDVFSEETERHINERAKIEIPPLKDDKNLIGYFTDNELKWWDDTVFYYFLTQPTENKTRQVLMRLIREHYKNNFDRLKHDFETGAAQDFAGLERETRLTLKPTGEGAEIIDKFMFLLASRYYKMVHDAIRRHDKNHLILGDRYPSWYSQAVVRASIPFVDVVSTNYMADWNDGNISAFYLDSLHRLTKKPVIVTEYYMCATENRSGNKNSSAAFPIVQTQKERAKSFQTNLTAYAELPYVIGAHWFQYYDEPANGRDSDGEDFNMGLIDIDNRPYEELTAAAASIRPEVIHAKAVDPPNKGTATVKVPPAEKEAEKGLRWWNKKNSFIPPAANVGNDFPFADLYASWNAENLYLAVYAIDFFEPRNYAGEVIPDAERMIWTINLGTNSKPLRIRFDERNEVKIGHTKIETRFWTTSTRSTMLVKLPAAVIGKSRWKIGDTVNLRAKLASHSRAEVMAWNRNLKLGEPGKSEK